jgi:3-oxoacyl-[acyl-carrier protein] reductase
VVDRYQSFVRTPVGQFLAKRLGLPNPPQLRRYRPGAPLVPGPVTVGGTGRLIEPARSVVESFGVAPEGSAATDTHHHAHLFDATGIKSSSELVGLQDSFTPILRSLSPSARLLVLGTPPDCTATASERVAQRALEGFTRSLAKEARNGATAQLVYVEPGAEDRLRSTIGFLLSYRSAFVDGQVVRVSTLVPAPQDASSTSDDRPLDTAVALVTGASRGIGAEICRTMHRYGATIVGVDVPQAGDGLIRLMKDLDGHPVLLDITAVDAPQRIARALREHFGGADIVVHNAGITRDRRLANMDADRFGSVIDVNLTAPERITAELLDQSLIRSNGRVVGIASIAGIAGNIGQTNYATSKAGVIGFIDAYTHLLTRDQITVNAVAPGFIETDMTGRLPLPIRQAGRRMSSLSQGGLPVDVSETVAWFAQPDSYGVTGNVVRVCGQSWLGA